jgi:hypothetical protein
MWETLILDVRVTVKWIWARFMWARLALVMGPCKYYETVDSTQGFLNQ